MAHKQPELLKILLRMLDDECNDIYLHIDKKSEHFPIEEMKAEVCRSRLVLTERTDVKWGTYSQINCELVLLKEAVKTEHLYYHLLSGMDLPLKPQSEIHAFFEKYDGLEFVGEDAPEISEDALARVKYHYYFYGKAGRIGNLLGALEMKAQKLIGTDRTKKCSDIIFQKGRNWFSITHGLAQFVVQKEAWIAETFKDSLCGDELFLQTIAENSEFAGNICNTVTMPYIPDTRLIDWVGGGNAHPYIFREDDFAQMMASDALFARKFDWNIDKRIVEKLYELLYIN